MCTQDPNADVRLPESVTFDASILTDPQDHVTRQLVSAQAVAEERAQEIARLTGSLHQCRQECEELSTRLHPMNYSRAFISRIYSRGRQWIGKPRS